MTLAMKYAFKLFFGSRGASAASAVFVVFMALFAWHKIDKKSAVRQAVAEYVAKAEIAAVRAQLVEANRRTAVANLALVQVQERMQVIEVQAEQAAIEIQRSEVDNEISTDGLVGHSLFDRLRAN